MIEVLLPIRTPSAANLREHWAVRAKRTRDQRAVARLLVRSNLGKLPKGKLIIRLTRIGPRLIRDFGNLPYALKAVQDGVADALGRDDGDPGIEWSYAQHCIPGGEPGVRVEIRSAR